MELKRLKIRKLFGLFDYDIELNRNGVTILTGPNGYGKTTILNIIYNLVNKEFDYLQKLKFESIDVELADDQQVKITKKKNDSIDVYNGTALKAIKVYLIREQRLISQSPHNFIDQSPQRFISNSSANKFNIQYTIDKYALELSGIIRTKQLEANNKSQELDPSFPTRLMECKKPLSEAEFRRRFEELTRKREKLISYGIATTKQDVPDDYTDRTAAVLTVYLQDSEQKVGVYDELLSKIELFVEILNDKLFTSKTLVINGADNFYFQSADGQRLQLSNLSSGEQEEVVLTYELLFRTPENSLILIDEPEISLHVVWQKAFIVDLQKIAELKHLSFVIATHAPAIINDRWDLTRDLYELANDEAHGE